MNNTNPITAYRFIVDTNTVIFSITGTLKIYCKVKMTVSGSKVMVDIMHNTYLFNTDKTIFYRSRAMQEPARILQNDLKRAIFVQEYCRTTMLTKI